MFYFSDLNFTQKLSILTRCPLQLQPVWAAAISWPILSGSVFTGLACATSWKKMKAIERTTNSSLITPSFLCFTNTSGTNYALIVCKQERASPDSSMSNRDCQLYFFLDGKSQMTKKTWKCNQCSYFSIKVILANSMNDFNNWRWHLWIVETKTIPSQTTLMLFQHTVSPRVCEDESSTSTEPVDSPVCPDQGSWGPRGPKLVYECDTTTTICCDCMLHKPQSLSLHAKSVWNPVKLQGFIDS